MKTNLVLHCGAHAVSRDQVYETNTPARTDTWCPIPHSQLIESVETGLRGLNLCVVEQAHSLTREGQRYFGLLQVARVDAQRAPEKEGDFGYIMGLRNSHDKSFPAGLVVGMNVFVCDNLSFNGEIKIARRHTDKILDDLPIITNRAVGLLAERWNRAPVRVEKYRTTEINDAQAHDIIIRALDAQAILARQIETITHEFRNPRHAEFAKDGKTAWRLFNAFTESAKGTSLVELSSRTTRLHGLFDNVCGLDFSSKSGGCGLNTDGVTDVEAIVNN